jgi:hypothetical protein
MTCRLLRKWVEGGRWGSVMFKGRGMMMTCGPEWVEFTIPRLEMEMETSQIGRLRMLIITGSHTRCVSPA